MKLIAAMLIFMTGGIAFAESDHELARKAASRNEIIPLSDVLDIIAQRYSAMPLKVELDRIADRYVYQFELIETDGTIFEVVVNAATGEILEVGGD